MEITQKWIDQQRKICDAATPGPWEADEYGDMVWAKNPYGHDLMRVADIRGWGHLTGSGACALPQTQAQGIQNANQVFIAAARTALPSALDALEAAYAEIARLTAERDAAVKCIRDTETYIQLESRKYAEKTISYWRGLCAENAPKGSADK